MSRIIRFLAFSATVVLCWMRFAGDASAQNNGMRTIEIGMLSTSHLLFTSDLTYVDVSSPDVIAAKVVEASKNMLALKARKEFNFTTTISALEANGTMHTFYVRYNSTPRELLIDTRLQDASASATFNTQVRPVQEQPQYQQQSSAPVTQQASSGSGRSRRDRRGSGSDGQGSPSQATGVSVTGRSTSNFGRSNAPTIEEVMRKDRGLYHISDKCYGLEANVVNVFAYSDLTYIVISLKNHSDIGYEAGDAQFTIENKKVSAKTLSTDKSIWPKSSFGTLSCPPMNETTIGYTVPKLTLQKNEVLKVYIYEKGGARNLFLTLDDKDVNYAVSPLR